MADTKAGGAGEANDAAAAATDGDPETFEEGSQEEHDAAIQGRLREAADAAIEAAQTAVEKTKAHAAGAEQALADAEAARAALGDE